MYKLEALFGEDDEQVLRVHDESYYIEGEIDEWLVISVPETTRIEEVQAFKKGLEQGTRRPVLVVTHNISFMRARKLTPNEAADVIRRAENDIISEEEAKSRLEEERRKIISQNDSGDGSGPRSDQHGGSSSGVDGEDNPSGESPDGADQADTGEDSQEVEDEGLDGRPKADV